MSAEGVVNVLVGDDGEGYEIWDYKAGQRPEADAELGDYRAQLHTYAELYRYRQGEYSDRGVIYFTGEETRDEAVFELEFEDGEVTGSINEFEQTVESIERDRQERTGLLLLRMTNHRKAPVRSVISGSIVQHGQSTKGCSDQIRSHAQGTHLVFCRNSFPIRNYRESPVQYPRYRYRIVD